MKDSQCVEFLQWALPRLRMRWPGFRKVRRQVCKRINRRLWELGLPDVSAYREYLGTHPAEWTVLNGFCRIPISRFYRDRGVFDFLRDEVLPSLAVAIRDSRDKRLRCWSAGCASGEEPYTLSMLWKLALAARFPDVVFELIATDIDPCMLDRARRGRYTMSSLKDLPQAWLSVAFTESDGEFSVKSEYRDGVHFLRQDIRREMPAGVFQLVLCRHVVFTYFDNRVQAELLRAILAKLVPGAVLVTGKQEPLPPHVPELRECGRHMGVYRLV